MVAAEDTISMTIIIIAIIIIYMFIPAKTLYPANISIKILYAF